LFGGRAHVATGRHGSPLRRMALRMVISLRMQAVRITLGFLPASRRAKAAIVELQRLATGAGDLPAGQVPELGQPRDQGLGQHRSDPGHAAQLSGHRSPLRVIGDQRGVAQVLELIAGVGDGPLQVGRTSRCSPRRSRAITQLSIGRHGRGELGDGGGVRPIVLGQAALGLSNAADPQRVDDDDGKR